MSPNSLHKGNILMIVPEPFLRPRGTPLSVYGRVRALSSLGYHVDIVTYHIGDDVVVDNVKIHRIPRVPFIREIPVGPSVPKILLDVLLLGKTLAMLLANHYDVIHSHEEGAFWGTVLARIFRKKHIYDMHSSLPQQFENFRYANVSLVKSFFGMMERFVIRSSNGVIYICAELKSVIDSIDPAKPAVLIENFGAEEGLGIADSGEGVDTRDSDGQFTLLYAGTLESYQGIDLLLRSLTYLKDVSFVLLIVGGEDEQIQHYRKMADELGVIEKVRFAGKVSPERVEQYYQLADALISTRVRGTNTPLKIYKYLMSGKPVIATRISSHTQVLNDEIAILVEPDEQHIAESIRQAITDGEMLERVKENARLYVQERFSYGRYLELTRRMYASV
jgi:glycosyltransferase involved in cell wall biosynthesis